MSSTSASSSSSSAPHVSHVMGYSSIRSRYPTSEKDLELEYQLRVREIRKIQEARKRMASGGGAGGGGENERSARMNACDLNGEEFQIVCEELWIDFRRWVNHNENMSDCIDTVREAFVRNWPSICLTIGFLMLFRWYVGAGKDACSYGVGYGMLSFTCEVLRHLGELVAAILLMFIAFCVGIMPMLLCVCFYEFNDAFPDPEGNEEDDEEDDRGHIKKE